MSQVKTTTQLRLELARKGQDGGIVNLTDQRNRIEEIQSALSNARILMEAVCFDRISEPEARAATYFAALALENLANGMAEDAVLFSMVQLEDAQEAQTEGSQ